MTVRVYVLPMVITLVGDRNYRAPKYLGSRNPPLAGLENIRYNCMDYGMENVCILIAEVTTAQHNLLSAQTDVLSAPQNIDNNLTAGAVTTVKNFLESLHIPANWVTTAHTYRDVLRLVGWLFQFMQRVHGIFQEKLFVAPNTLSTTYSQLSVGMQSALLQAAQSFSFDTTGLQASTTLRVILKNLADQFNARPLNSGLMVL
jgi:hypothetical protein